MSWSFTARGGPAIFGIVGLFATPVLAGTWTQVALPLTATPSFNVSPTSLQLLSDGRVLVGDGAQGFKILTPSNDGKYETGTWSDATSSHVSRALFPSTMLNDGRYLILGGEDTAGPDHSSMDIYDPVTDTWTLGPDMPALVYDAPASILPNGKFLVGSSRSGDVYIYDPATNAWTKSAHPLGTGTGVVNSGSEKGWTLLQNGLVLDGFDVWSLYNPGTSTVNIPPNNTPLAPDSWSAAASIPVNLLGNSPEGGREIGPMSLLHSGKVIQFGAANTPSGGQGGQGHTAIYDPVANSWSAGPDPSDGHQFADHPAAVMPSDHVLCVTGIDEGGSDVVGYWEYDSTTTPNTLTPVAAPPFGLGQAPLFLMLPTGQVLVSAGTNPNFALYNPTGTPQPGWRPTVSPTIPAPTAGVFTLSGTQLNGLTTGASYGDDNNMGTNFPIVSLATGSQKFYARSFAFSTMTPGVGTSGTCKFTLPPQIPNGTYTVRVSASGVESTTSATLAVTGQHVTQLTGGADNAAPGTTTTWTVSLATAAGPSGTTVNLSSDNTSVATVPATVTVQSLRTSQTFTVTSHGFGRAFISAVTAVANPEFMAAKRAFGWTVSAVRADPNPANPVFTEKFTISNPAPTGGVTLNLSSNVPLIGMPATVTVPAGWQDVWVMGINPTINPGLVTITASMLNSSQMGYLTDTVTNVSDYRWAWLLMLNALTQPTMISNLTVADTANAANWSVQSNLPVGATQYGDRTFTLTSIPASLRGATWIRTANSSKLFTGNPTVTFTISQQADVYVAEDTRLPKPSWMGGTWVDSGMRLANSESPATMFELFKKTFPAGTVSLGPNGGVSTSDMYTVIVP